VEEHRCAITEQNAATIVAPYDVVVDGVDSFETRYVINDACYALDKPSVHGSVSGFDGQASVFWPRKGPCYRCLYPGPPDPAVAPYRSAGAIFGPAAALVGAIQAAEVLKIVLRCGDPLVGRLLTCDTLAMHLTELSVTRDDACPLCGSHALRRAADHASSPATPPWTANAVGARPRARRGQARRNRLPVAN
jgi:adenylyltransferase/sulfurtransferase